MGQLNIHPITQLNFMQRTEQPLGQNLMFISEDNQIEN
jgi:hypothetical protein